MSKEMNLDNLASQKNKAQTKIKEGQINNSTGVTNMEKFEKELNVFIAETFLMWYGKENAEGVKIIMKIVPLSEIDYKQLKIADPSKYGQYTINPETAGMNYQEREPKIKILDMKKFVDKPRSEVMKAVIEKYNGQYYIPGLEYEKYLFENLDKIPKELKDENNNYFMGSILHGQFGDASLSCVHWLNKKLDREALQLYGKWQQNDRVILLEK